MEAFSKHFQENYWLIQLFKWNLFSCHFQLKKKSKHLFFTVKSVFLLVKKGDVFSLFKTSIAKLYPEHISKLPLMPFLPSKLIDSLCKHSWCTNTDKGHSCVVCKSGTHVRAAVWSTSLWDTLSFSVWLTTAFIVKKKIFCFCPNYSNVQNQDHYFRVYSTDVNKSLSS